MMPTHEMRRGAGFWAVSGLALSLSILSWVSPILILGVNRSLSRADLTDGGTGEWLYLALLAPLSALLVWMIVRLPSDPESGAAQPATEHASVAGRWIFDPLMALRALACLLVLIGHFFGIFFAFAGGAYFHGAMTLLRSSAWGGVWVFFTLSGFLMGKGFVSGRYSLDGRGMRAFLRNRLIRIAPVYYSAILLITVFRDPALMHRDSLWMIVRACLFDSPGYMPIPPLWSVSTEMQFYLLVPALAVVLLRLRGRLGKAFLLVPVLLMVLETVLRTWLVHHSGQPTNRFVYTPVMTNLDIFIAGMSVSMLEVPKVVSQGGRKALNAVLVVGLVALYVGISYITQNRDKVHMSTLESFWALGPVLCAVPSAIYIFLAEMRGKVELKGGLVSRCLMLVQGMGTLTYCIYVFHADVFASNGAWFDAVQPLRASLHLFPLVMVETLLVAGFFYTFMEKPFNLKKKVPGTPLMDAP